jgi:23S rRNA (adenine2030-N6)-methyltransferase
MNYRHNFHAGNFADVMKHITLTFILEKLCEKPAPFCVIDTHAGQGLYDLQGEAALRTSEADEGILKLLAYPIPSPLFLPYLKAVRAVNQQEIRFYPGSPKVAQAFIREHDRLLLTELHPESCATLKMLMAKEKRAQIFERDGYASLKALLPPPEKRGVILIDPPFEKKDEREQIIKALAAALKRFAHGIYMIWYPIKSRNQLGNFQNQIRQLSPEKYLSLDFYLYRDEHANRLNGSGLIILNPPWQLREKLEIVMPELLAILGRAERGEIIIKGSNG